MKVNIKCNTDSWEALLVSLEADCEAYLDPFYEMTEAGEELLDYCYEVEGEMPFWLEPSVQAGQGGIWIYDNETDETIASNIDYADFNNNVLDLAFESSNAAEFKKKYKEYLMSLVD